MVLVAFLLLCRSLPAQESGTYGGQLILSTTSDPRSFNPIVAKETSTTAITGLIFEGLTTSNGITLEVEPHLAKSWEVDASGLIWIFYLRDDVYWFDGKQFSADDVVFTFEDLIYNAKIPNSSRDIFTIDGEKLTVEKVDDFTVRFILPVKFAPFLRSLSQEILPKHILQEAARSGRFNFTWGIDTPTQRIIGTGPFMLNRYVPGERIMLVRNPRYWKVKDGQRLPYLDRLIFMIVQSQDTGLLKFLDGQLDYYGLRGIDYPLLKPQEQEGNFTVYNTGPAFGSNFLVFNQNARLNPKTDKPYVDPIKLAWFRNTQFRKAVAHAIDKEKIIEILMNDLGFSQHSGMSPSSGFFYSPEVIAYDYNLKKAKKILKDAGFSDRNLDGYLEDTVGNTVEFSLFTNSGNTTRVQIAAIIRKDLDNIGIKVNFLSLDFNNLVGKMTSTFDWDAIIMGLTGGIEPHHGKNVWHSSGQLHMWNPRQDTPATQWEKRIDEIFDLGVQELDNEKRKALYDQWQYIVSEELPFIYTVLPSSIFAVRNKFGNLHPTAYGGAFHNLEEIYIIKDDD
ncbi:ABC transporter substrate-binding protein [Candidatus Omnitrophota bacterium]